MATKDHKSPTNTKENKFTYTETVFSISKVVYPHRVWVRLVNKEKANCASAQHSASVAYLTVFGQFQLRVVL